MIDQEKVARKVRVRAETMIWEMRKQLEYFEVQVDNEEAQVWVKVLKAAIHTITGD
jgi:hypothetical protein